MPDDRHKAITFTNPEYIPASVNFLPATWAEHREGLEEVVARHPIIFGEQQAGNRDFDAAGGTYVEGEHVDRWGCVWSNIAHGAEAIVTGHPVPTREDVHTLEAPELVDGSFPHGFMYLRLQDLRGFNELMVDFAEEPPELQALIDIVLDYNMRNLEVRLERDTGDTVGFGDDLGMQTTLPMSPEKWRQYLKPCFAAMYGRCRDAGRGVYMHSDGHILEIIGDLIECGVTVINPQIRANGLDGLVEECKGKVCVDLDLDRQLFPFATPDEIDEHIRSSIEALGSPEGGLLLKAECGPCVSLEIIEAICVALEKYRGYFRAA
ncbi:hypothetical protein HN371_19785 [Candidatus Poribacteria bacterium]|nr:hypothetical protein [Candidatus Poribacteria bacterium]MBT5533597.1 hypothetical protein [Candidatus Poribacteria bacterium]MBT5712568.1 hypothetical protein [Candidatus Poribacteria bacterium]MBT7804533.1 hypothetical protein [Candidatus Poribacteria bacterium]